jgi:hypothetical protein
MHVRRDGLQFSWQQMPFLQSLGNRKATVREGHFSESSRKDAESYGPQGQARGYYLHILGYHEGSLREDEVAEELEKARKYVEDVKNLLKEQKSVKEP